MPRHPEATAKAATLPQRRRERKRPKGQSGRFQHCRGAVVSLKDEDRLSMTISFRRLLACLPRLILSSRIRFSAFLANSFHTVRSGSCPASTVFPIPVPWTGVFDKQGIPKLNHRRWQQLCFKRGLHICVIALNYVYNGLQPVPVALLLGGGQTWPTELSMLV